MIDLIRVTVLQKRLEGIADEMSHVLRRTAYSPNIKERADFSCAIFDSNARLIAQAEAIPVHLGSMGFVAKPILDKYKDIWKPGDAIIVNSPRGIYGGTHLPDITLVSPVFRDGKLKFIVANRAHHADVGGMTPGSLPGKSTEIFQEGLIIPPVMLFKQFRENSDVMDIIMENVRTPRERRGDLRAQYSSLSLGARRLEELLNEFDDIDLLVDTLLNWSEKSSREILSKLPQKEVKFEDYLDSDGISNKPVKISCKLKIKKGGEIVFDFSGSDPQQRGNCNAPISITTSAVYYVIRLITGREVATNDGCFRSVKIIAPEGCVVNPTVNAATSSANTETSQRIVDVVMGCFAQIIDFPAASQGTMNNVLIGGTINNKNWTIYETIGGGSGATPHANGTSAVHTHMTNTENTPVEALELTYPIRILEYSIRENSGGSGKYTGGDGIIRKIEFLSDATLSLQTERRKRQPWGVRGGKGGKKGVNLLINGDKIIELDGRGTTDVKKGMILQIETPGGGGYGEP